MENARFFLKICCSVFIKLANSQFLSNSYETLRFKNLNSTLLRLFQVSNFDNYVLYRFKKYSFNQKLMEEAERPCHVLPYTLHILPFTMLEFIKEIPEVSHWMMTSSWRLTIMKVPIVKGSQLENETVALDETDVTCRVLIT